MNMNSTIFFVSLFMVNGMKIKRYACIGNKMHDNVVGLQTVR